MKGINVGCWSESCAISGLEIGYDVEAVAMFLKPIDSDYSYNHGAFCRFTPVCPPTYGIYSDYGDFEKDQQIDNPYFLDLFEKGRRAFDPDKDDHMQYMYRLWWCRKDVWDFCDTLKHEFSYGDRPKTIGESITRQREEIMKYVNDAMNPLETDDADELFDRQIRRMMSSKDIFGLSRLDGKYVIGLKIALDDAIDKRDLEKIENIIESSQRILKIELIGDELRKIICPSTLVGPQHAGYGAIAQMAEFTAAKCKEYFVEDEIED